MLKPIVKHNTAVGFYILMTAVVIVVVVVVGKVLPTCFVSAQDIHYKTDVIVSA